MTDPRYFSEQLAYKAMVTTTDYRPAAPSDRMGTITAPIDELDLEAEARKYAQDFDRADGKFDFGYADYADRQAFVWIVEAARNLGGINGHAVATRLLRMALDDLETRHPIPKEGRDL